MLANALITNEAGIFGLLMGILGVIFYTTQLESFKKFYSYVPSLLLCYFLPGLLNSFGIIDPSESKIYYIASRYLLPACLILLTLSVDFKGIIGLGPKALIMFFTGTIGIIIGGPIAFFIVTKIFGGLSNFSLDELYRGMTTVAGSWIGGGANQTAMKEIFEVPNKVFSVMVVVDVIVANIWMAVLIYLISKSKKIDKFNKADRGSIDNLITEMDKRLKENKREVTLNSLMTLSGISFFIVGGAHMSASAIAPFIKNNYPELLKFSLGSHFFWLILISTLLGVLLSFTKAKNLEGVGASKLANLFLYVLIASIGMQMNIFEIFNNLEAFLIGSIWMLFHAVLLILVAKIIRAPLFFLAVGSQANVGGAASAPIIAGIFHPSLSSVGVLLAVLGYVIGTYGAWICGQLMGTLS